MKAALLQDRTAVRVAGPDSPAFLNNLLTSAVEALLPGQARYGALLTPQGKILTDLIAFRTAEGFLLDTPSDQSEALVKRLMLYRLRAKIEIAIPDDDSAPATVALWDSETTPDLPSVVRDPRLPALGYRALLPRSDLGRLLAGIGAEARPQSEWESWRIGLGVPAGGLDFPFGDTFPHEADMDQLSGVDFDKGCFIGQEVVSRMQHRGTARTRVVPVRIEGIAPPPGTDVRVGERQVGSMGSSSGDRGLALLRLDRVEGVEQITSGNARLWPERPGWARFAFPGDALPEGAAS